MMFEKKNSKRACEKKRKERKKDECVFCLFFSLAKKKLFHSHNTQTSNIKFLVIFIRRTKDTLYIFIIIIIYK